MNENAVPLPTITSINAPFYKAAREGKLSLQKCARCEELIYYPRVACPECLSMEFNWTEMSGYGTVHSFSFVWRPQHPAFFDKAPLILVAIRLDEGVLMLSHLVECQPEDVSIGMRTRVVFDEIAEGIYLPKFRPVEWN